MRALASIRKIDSLDPIPDADKILKATIGGWEVVTAKDNGFSVGDLVVYLEVDSWVPYELAPFLVKVGNSIREFNGVKGERLRTIRLRGHLSQGLILPISSLTEYQQAQIYFDGLPVEGLDVTELLGVQKWERPIPPQLSGQMKGNFPSFIPKTDAERAQNLSREILVDHIDDTWEISLKMDGSSMTVYRLEELGDERVGVCSRNLDLVLEQEGNTFVDIERKIGIIEALRKLNLNLAIQGELVGPGIQGNKDGFSEHHFFVFNIYDIKEGRYLQPDERQAVFLLIREHCSDIKHVPILTTCTIDNLLFSELIQNISIQSLLEFAQGKSYFGNTLNEREGLVWKSYDSPFQFKTISNRFLEKNKDE